MLSASTMRTLRRWHLYAGMFLAPALMLFALSGAVQVFRLNEAKGWGGPPPAVLVAMGDLHKNQALAKPHIGRAAPRPEGAGAAGPAALPEARPAPARPADAKPPQPNPSRLALQIFAILAGIGLAFSIASGIVITLSLPLLRRGGLIALALGLALPAAILIL